MSETHENPNPLSPDAIKIAIARGRGLRSEAYRSGVLRLFAGASRLIRTTRGNAGRHAGAKPTFGNTA